MQKKFFLVALSGLLVGASAFGKPGIFGDWGKTLVSIGKALIEGDAEQSQLVPDQRAEIPGLRDIKNQVDSDLKDLPPLIRNAICGLVEKLAATSPVIRSSFDGVVAQGKNLSHAAAYQQYYHFLDQRLAQVCPNEEVVRQATIRSLLGNLDASLKGMNGLDAQKLKRHFDNAVVDKAVRNNRSNIASLRLATEEIAPPSYFVALGLPSPVVSVRVDVMVGNPPPYNPNSRLK